MKITVPYAYTESYVPPRCRKPRDLRVEASITLTIREIASTRPRRSSRDAPTPLPPGLASWLFLCPRSDG